jgi:malonyl-CoA decarboxylase
VKDQARSGFFKRRLESIARLWGGIAGDEYDRDTARLRPHLPPEDRPALLEKMRQCLDPGGGEILARAHAASLGQTYLALNDEGRAEFLRMLAAEFDIREANVTRALERWSNAESPLTRRLARLELRRATESPRSQIMTRFNALPQGVKFLVDMRSDLLPLAEDEPDLASLDDDIKDLLTAWFDVDFLELRRISWDTATGALLEKFMAYEAVHPVESWDDLKDRLDYDRRYFAFFHPRMRDEPLIFLEVALVRNLAASIQELLDPNSPTTDPDDADTAIFYSISNAQRGLVGVSFGGFLIKRVVDALAVEFPGLKTYATLSPLTGFINWLVNSWGKDQDAVASEDSGERLFHPSEQKRIVRLAVGADRRGWFLKAVCENAWLDHPDLEKVVRPILLRLAAEYLTRERREEGGALDLVAHFHLSNGASLHRLNWAADISEKGLEQSAGIMANYLYDYREIEENHEAYRSRGRVAASQAVRALLKD